ncbi:MAG: hypothetical protein NTZ91_02065 [Actinobacteria bacterium]|nr:hypothetical protein [Actinomycetota bacterium]
MNFIMSAVEDGTVAGPGLSAIETVVTFILIPIALFAVIAVLSWAVSTPRKATTTSSITSIN